MSDLQMRLPTGGMKWAAEAVADLVGQTTTVIDVEGTEHPGKIVAAEADGIKVTVETTAKIPESQVTAFSIAPRRQC
jgi:hypothetical protein